MFDTMIQGADKYISESSTWLIFTEERRWVIEFTNTKTLWFNYHLFQSELNLLGMDCVESKDIIKEWFESRFFGIDVENTIQNGVKNSQSYGGESLKLVEDTIQNGVKLTRAVDLIDTERVEDAIQWCVKDTRSSEMWMPKMVENEIQNGVKKTSDRPFTYGSVVEETIQNGVKHTSGNRFERRIQVEETIQNGVKETCGVKSWGSFGNKIVEHTIQTGVKQILVSTLESFLQEDHKVTSQSFTDKIEDAIDNGVKTVMQGSEWYHQDEVNDLIENKIKE